MSTGSTTEILPAEADSSRRRVARAITIRRSLTDRGPRACRNAGGEQRLWAKNRAKPIANPIQPRSSQLIENKATSQKSIANFLALLALTQEGRAPQCGGPMGAPFPPGPSRLQPPQNQSTHSFIRNRYNSIIQKEKTFSNRNKKRLFRASLSRERQSPDWQVRATPRRSCGFTASPIRAAVDLAAALPYACSLTTRQNVATRIRALPRGGEKRTT